jgi:hypothetical protein
MGLGFAASSAGNFFSLPLRTKTYAAIAHYSASPLVKSSPLFSSSAGINNLWIGLQWRNA